MRLATQCIGSLPRAEDSDPAWILSFVVLTPLEAYLDSYL